MRPEVLRTFRILMENMSDDDLVEYALIIALEVTRRGKSTPRDDKILLSEILTESRKSVCGL